MEANKRSINDVFNGMRVLEVPFFQRSYVWGEPQWERLLSDMEFISETGKPYFLGSIILKNTAPPTGRTSGDRRTLIDGQQRLTTLNLFFKSLCLKKAELTPHFDRIFRLMLSNEIALDHNHNDKEDFDTIMELTEDVAAHGESGVVAAYNYFQNGIDLDKLDFETILSHMMFVVIDLSAGEDEQQIFDTINSLGVRLTTAELLKNHFFGRNDIASYESNWRDVFEKDVETKAYWDREITAGRTKRENIDLFFYSYLQIKLQDHSLNVSADDKKHLTKVEGLFDSYKTLISKYGLDKQKLIREIREYAVIYRNFIDFDVVDRELPPEPSIDRINLIMFGLENTTLIPFVLYVLRNVESPIVRREIFQYLEAYIMRRVVCHTSNKNYNRLFSEELLSGGVLSLAALKELIERKSDKSNYMPTNEDMKRGWHESRLTNKQSAGILYMLESATRNRDVQSTALLGLDRYSLEHVMPKKWENHWNSVTTEEERIRRNRKLLTLGNLTIITSSLNTSIRDADWPTKKAGRKDKKGLIQYAGGIETFSGYLEHEEWNETTIVERANHLAELAETAWQN